MRIGQSLESIQSSAAEITNWFTINRTVGLAVVALTAAGVENCASQIISTAEGAQAARKLIPNDGFSAASSGIETQLGGNSITIDMLQDGHCLFVGVQARLIYGPNGKVADVTDYTFSPYDEANGVTMPPTITSKTMVIVQNAAELHLAEPQLRC
jgi:hypothetical protein